jgi:hypothetical protein
MVHTTVYPPPSGHAARALARQTNCRAAAWETSAALNARAHEVRCFIRTFLFCLARKYRGPYRAADGVAACAHMARPMAPPTRSPADPIRMLRREVGTVLSCCAFMIAPWQWQDSLGSTRTSLDYVLIRDPCSRRKRVGTSPGNPSASFSAVSPNRSFPIISTGHDATRQFRTTAVLFRTTSKRQLA